MNILRIDTVLGCRPALAAFVAGGARRAFVAATVGAALASGTTACSQSARKLASPAAPSPSSSVSSAVLASPGEASEAVAEFLDAAARRDHAAMAQLFGTREGPEADTRGWFACVLRKLGSWLRLSTGCPVPVEVERRMELIAQLLAQGAYQVRGEAPVAGRDWPAMQVVVEATLAAAGRGAGDAPVVEVPFVVVKSRDGRWRVQQVTLDRLMG